MKNKFLVSYPLSFLIVLTYSCSGQNVVAKPTSSSTPTMTSSSTPSRTPTPLPIPTQTPMPQTLGRIFPDKFHGQSVWSNGGGNKSRNYKDQQWFCPPDGSTTVCKDHVMHFDVSLPKDFTSSDNVLSPVDGYIEDIYDPGEGKSIVIVPEPPFAGVQELLNNRARIDVLAKGVFKFNYTYNDVQYVSFHLAHVLPLVKIGDKVTRGQIISTVNFNVPFTPKKVAYIIYLHMKDGSYYQFSPCDVPNEDEFCGKCTAGSPYPCP